MKYSHVIFTAVAALEAFINMLINENESVLFVSFVGNKRTP